MCGGGISTTEEHFDPQNLKCTEASRRQDLYISNWMYFLREKWHERQGDLECGRWEEKGKDGRRGKPSAVVGSKRHQVRGCQQYCCEWSSRWTSTKICKSLRMAPQSSSCFRSFISGAKNHFLLGEPGISGEKNCWKVNRYPAFCAVV